MLHSSFIVYKFLLRLDLPLFTIHINSYKLLVFNCNVNAYVFHNSMYALGLG